MGVGEKWQDDGACRRLPVEMFFPPVEQEADEAKAICASCAVQQPCLEFALASSEPFGIWGGLTSQERARLATQRRKAAALATARAR